MKIGSYFSCFEVPPSFIPHTTRLLQSFLSMISLFDLRVLKTRKLFFSAPVSLYSVFCELPARDLLTNLYFHSNILVCYCIYKCIYNMCSMMSLKKPSFYCMVLHLKKIHIFAVQQNYVCHLD